jgi:hypothetical protein
MVATLVALGGPFFASPALAAGEPASLKDVVASVYPEYDDPLGLGSPTVLVMLDGQIDGAVPPTTIRFLVPKEALMYSAGSGPRQQYVGGPPNRVASDIQGWDEISYELKTGYFVVEYYVPIQASPNKAFSVPIIVPYPIDGLTAIVQEPRKATGFSVVPQTQPANQQQYTDAQGFNITSYTYDALDGSQELSFSVSYTKTDPTPSLEIKGKGSSPVGLIVAVALAGVLVFGLVTYGVRRKSASSRHNKHNISARPQAKKVAGANFCPKCGAKLENSQKFCHQCGTRLRERQSRN